MDGSGTAGLQSPPLAVAQPAVRAEGCCGLNLKELITDQSKIREVWIIILDHHICSYRKSNVRSAC